MTIHHFLRASALAVTLSFSAFTFAADVDHNADVNDLAIQGYDSVSYFTGGAPVKGTGDYSATFKNAIYHFASAENRDLFKQDPEKYAPQYGGFCAFGVSMNRKFDTDPLAYKIVDNKLYLNLNTDVQKKWLTDVSGYLATSEQNWSDIKGHTDAVLAEQ